MENKQITWSLFFRELAEKMMEWKDKRQEFAEWLADDIGALDKDYADSWSPITILQLYIGSSAKKYLKVPLSDFRLQTREKLGVAIPEPEDLATLCKLADKLYFFQWDIPCTKTAGERLWLFTEDLLKGNGPTLNMIRTIKDTTNLSGDIFSICFLVDSVSYLPLTLRNVSGLELNSYMLNKNQSAEDILEQYRGYLKNANRVIAEHGLKDYYSLTKYILEDSEKKQGSSSKIDDTKDTHPKIWFARDPDKKNISYCLENLILFFDSSNSVGDKLLKYQDANELSKEEGFEGVTNGTTAQYSYWQLSHDVKIGDLFFYFRKPDILTAWGVATSGYIYDTAALYHSRINVKWTTLEYELSNLPVKHSSGLWFKEKTKTEVQPLLDLLNIRLDDIEIPKKEAMKHQKYISLLEEHCNLILTGAPGTGKTYLAKEIAKEMILQQETDADELQDDELEKLMKERTGFVQFHPSFDYTDFVEGLRPIEKGDTLGFKRKDGIFKEFCKRALAAAKKATEEGKEAPKYIFIIDEINRGELSKIFGELFFSIDPGYRGEKGRVKTQYQILVSEDKNDDFFDGFYISENVYILGTMNDIDRSVESMDFAMRRRFAWKEIKAMDRVEMLDELNEYKDEAIARMGNLNEEISRIEGLGDAFHIGPAYFRKLKNGDFHQLWEMNLEPLLKEYLRGMRDANEKMKGLENAYNREKSSSVEEEDTNSDIEQ